MIALLMGAAGCGCAGQAGGMSDSTFVATMAELRKIAATSPGDSARIAAARAAALQRRGLTPAQLERAAGALADDPDHAAKVWQAIARKTSSTATRP
jgi:hypothetical protein